MEPEMIPQPGDVKSIFNSSENFSVVVVVGVFELKHQLRYFFTLISLEITMEYSSLKKFHLNLDQ